MKNIQWGQFDALAGTQRCPTPRPRKKLISENIDSKISKVLGKLHVQSFPFQIDNAAIERLLNEDTSSSSAHHRSSK